MHTEARRQKDRRRKGGRNESEGGNSCTRDLTLLTPGVRGYTSQMMRVMLNLLLREYFISWHEGCYHASRRNIKSDTEVNYIQGENVRMNTSFLSLKLRPFHHIHPIR